jgi:ParB-like nuclease domain
VHFLEALVLRWAAESLLDLSCAQIGEHYGRYRLHQPEAERAMARSLDRYGQLSPVVVCQREGYYELIDGFKRLGAARRLASLSHLSARLLEVDDRAAKAGIYGLNRAGVPTRNSILRPVDYEEAAKVTFSSIRVRSYKNYPQPCERRAGMTCERLGMKKTKWRLPVQAATRS